MFGLFGPRLRGFRPRSEVNYFKFMPVVIGLLSGYYIFGEPLELAAKDVEKEVACKKPEASVGASPQSGPSKPSA